ncbi:MAG: hypothetical protein EAX90_15700 [Candidatus Heimdallarchaeota archaeon]|nr:hypothetical protein [Candidatus Heimdallarchaeota archaeon]
MIVMMRSRTGKFYLISLFIILIATLASNSHTQNGLAFNYYSESISSENIFKNTIIEYNESEPLLIDSNTDFDANNFTGEGTENNPYIIKNLNITATGTTMAIEIKSTTAYFIIRDCLIVSEYIGIGVQNIAFGTCEITSNIIISSTGDGGGISLYSLGGCNITDNQCSNFMQGIHLNVVNDCLIKGNNLIANNYQGINIRYSNRNEILYNTIRYSAQHGLALVGTSYDNIIYQNEFCNNSLEEDYIIDGERTGTINSQGYDEGTNNKWYDEESKTGNRWTDYEGRGTYTIDGPANSEDKYPMIYSADESNAANYSMPIIFTIISIYFILVKKKKERSKKE